MSYDIFISYRRSDAEAYARLLYNDLRTAGYSVFYDYKELGGGDYVDAIKEAISACKDFVVLLSQDALGDRIGNVDDPMRMEISFAHQQNKRIVGIMLSGFDSFPEGLPSDLSFLPRINCLYGKTEYYDAMFGKLTSGQFLLSIPERQEIQNQSQPSTLEDSLSWFIPLSVEKKQKYMTFLLQLAHEFNADETCLRVYEYLDNYFRAAGVSKIPPYNGRIPTDFATYLAFFENMYLIVLTETVDISMIDEGYRFRFFAACNNPEIQKSELLALGYQYPRIFALYDYWSEYIRVKQSEKPDGSTLFEAFPGYERDLHITYGLYCFSNNFQQKKIRLINGKFQRVELEFRLLTQNDFDRFVSLQHDVLDSIPNNTQRNIFEPLTADEIQHSLVHDTCVGVFDEGGLVGLASFIVNPTQAQNLLHDIADYSMVPAEQTMIIDCILVSPKYRGFGLQRIFLTLADFIAEKRNVSYSCAVVSPQNNFSSGNFIRCGYQEIDNLPKYHSRRDYFVKSYIFSDSG